MSFRGTFHQVLATALSVVNVFRSRVADDGDIELLVDDSTVTSELSEGIPFSEVWTIAGVVSRPKAGSEQAGFAKALRIQIGDATYVLATHDPREMEECADGELLLHALGKTGSVRATVRLKPNGDVDITGTNITIAGSTRVRLGASGSFGKVAIGEALAAIVGLAFAAPIAANSPGGGAAAFQTALAAALTSAGFTTAASAMSAKHEVEK